MGNRAVITTEGDLLTNGIGVYLHWNGGRDSVEAFLKYCELKGFRSPDRDSYGWARLVQVIANYVGGGLSVGIGTINALDCENGDNGTYLIEEWKIVGRRYFGDTQEEQDYYDLEEMLESIDNAQPSEEQIGIEVISKLLQAELEGHDEPFEGDVVAVEQERDGANIYKRCTIIGEGEQGRIVNGTDVSGLKVVDLYDGGANNINNYLRDEVRWILVERNNTHGGTRNMGNDEVYYSFIKHIGVLEEYATGWRKEVNLVSWNGAPAKIDIRDWSPSHEHMSRGVTLHPEEAEKLMEALCEHFGR